MRGFRASRAVQNTKSARYGKHVDNPHNDEGHLDGVGTDQVKNMMRLRLPEWLRMPPAAPTRDKEPKVIPINRAKKSPRMGTGVVRKTTRTTRVSRTSTSKTVAKKRKAA